MAFKYKPSKAQAREYGEKMREIEQFCKDNAISQSFSGDSYYFKVNGKEYRVSNHTVEASNAKAFDEDTGEKKRELYHEGGREDDVIYIHAGKTRIIEIYNDIKAGFSLDKRGNRILK